MSITDPANPEAPTDAAGQIGVESTGVCPVCHSATDGQTVACPNCRQVHHQDCWSYNRGCGKYGCQSAPPTDKLQDLEIPPSFWGQTDKECPVCQSRIKAAALRCRHCGTVFGTTRPQDSTEFRAERTLAGDLPRLRRKVTLLLIFSILPFTAALAAIVGGLWYAANRHRLAALPASQVAIARIALLIAIGQTVILGLVAALHAVFA